jgi:hypothetical protein
MIGAFTFLSFSTMLPEPKLCFSFGKNHKLTSLTLPSAVFPQPVIVPVLPAGLAELFLGKRTVLMLAVEGKNQNAIANMRFELLSSAS